MIDNSMHNSIRVLIVKNYNRLVSGLITALTINPDIDLVGTASDAVEAIAHCQQLNPDVVLVELVMPELDGVSTIQKIHQCKPHIQIVTISKFAEESLVRQARQAGAVGNVRLGDSADSIAATIRNVFDNAACKQQLHVQELSQDLLESRKLIHKCRPSPDGWHINSKGELKMARPITLFTGQWADLPLETLAQKVSEWGYDGLELACWGDHFEVDKALENDSYLQEKRDLLEKYDLKCWAISTHLVGQCVCDHPIDERHKSILPSRIWGDGDPEGVRQRAAEEVKNTARAAAALGVKIVNGFTGSSIWHTLAMFPPVPAEMIEAGYKDFADRWNPIIDVFDEVGVKFALEVHPSEIAYDYWTAQATLEAIGRREGFGFNYDPSHLYWQMVDPVGFVYEYGDRIYHMHVKESIRKLNGRNGILGSHLLFGDHRRGWDFVSPGRGGVPFEQIFRALNDVNYEGPYSIEWEDNGMNRDQGAPEALDMARRLDLTPSDVAFDDAFSSDN